MNKIEGSGQLKEAAGGITGSLKEKQVQRWGGPNN
jgi:hypothetical protein